MNDFVQLVIELGKSNSILTKQGLLVKYFSSADDRDKLWTIALFTGKKPKKSISSTLLKLWCTEICQLPEWLFNESYQTVGDLAETIALLLPYQNQNHDYSYQNLAEIIEALTQLSNKPEEEKKDFITKNWKKLDRNSCFVFNKLITGGFRIGISQNVIFKSIAIAENLSPDTVAYIFSGNWHPSNVQYCDIINNDNKLKDISKPYPFYLSYPIENNLNDLGTPGEWIAEWKWDGIRGQYIKRNNQHFIWSRGEELVTDQFPELYTLLQYLPDGTVIDGEILCADTTHTSIHPLPFALLQKRITRKKISPKILKEAPVIFVVYDLLEWNHEDLRMQSLSYRKKILQDLISNTNTPNIRLSESIEFENWDDLSEIRSHARDNSTEGIMLKRKSSPYQSGRKKGDWWKWKVDPLTIDCVLVYAQKGHGRRSGLYTDYTFAVKDGDKLVSFTKAYSGLTDAEIREVDDFIKRNALEKFGPVRTVKPELVFEIAFEGIAVSKRHKAGIALRFPRMKRIRKDKTADEINTLEDLKSMLHQYG